MELREKLVIKYGEVFDSNQLDSLAAQMELIMLDDITEDRIFRAVNNILNDPRISIEKEAQKGRFIGDLLEEYMNQIQYSNKNPQRFSAKDSEYALGELAENAQGFELTSDIDSRNYSMGVEEGNYFELYDFIAKANELKAILTEKIVGMEPLIDEAAERAYYSEFNYDILTDIIVELKKTEIDILKTHKEIKRILGDNLKLAALSGAAAIVTLSAPSLLIQALAAAAAVIAASGAILGPSIKEKVQFLRENNLASLRVLIDSLVATAAEVSMENEKDLDVLLEVLAYSYQLIDALETLEVVRGETGISFDAVDLPVPEGTLDDLDVTNPRDKKLGKSKHKLLF